ncbi:MAG TPA: hypothetical protein VGM72_09880 [Micropepsaceae bacterium]|jgi:hypothetical protein
MSTAFKPALLVCLLLLAGAAQYFIDAVYVSPREKAAHDLAALAGVLQVENAKKPIHRAQENRGTTIPDLLSRVQELAGESGVTLMGAEPLPGDGEQFKLHLTANYGSFLEFLAHFETLQVDIAGFDVTSAMDEPGALEISLSFNHTSAPNAIRPERIKAFMARLKDAELRDPFNPANSALHLVNERNADDLTWTFRLTSISEIGKVKYATIDGKDYSLGDRIQGFVIGAIGEDHVTLIGMKDGKELQRLLTFRSRSKDRT